MTTSTKRKPQPSVYRSMESSTLRIFPIHPPSPSILLTALLQCARLSGSELMHDFTHEDGSLEQLFPDDISLCSDAKPKISRMHIHSSSYVFAPGYVPYKCSTPSLCVPVARSLLSDFQMDISKTPMPSSLRLVISGHSRCRRRCAFHAGGRWCYALWRTNAWLGTTCPRCSTSSVRIPMEMNSCGNLIDP